LHRAALAGGFRAAAQEDVMQDKPSDLPKRRPDGRPLAAITDVLLERRATTHFQPDPIPPEHLEAILSAAAQAPSGYNLQPWRFVVVGDADAKRRLQQAAFGQAKVSEAPVCVIALGMKEEWRRTAREVFEEGARRGLSKPEDVDKGLQGALAFLDTQDMRAWVNRHVMIAVTTMMLVAEAYGFDTAPMEGFDAEAVKREFGVPDEAEVVALLAIGTAAKPIKKYPGRFALDRIVFADRYGEPWHAPSGHATEGRGSSQGRNGA
jgi:nitroreductase